MIFTNQDYNKLRLHRTQGMLTTIQFRILYFHIYILNKGKSEVHPTTGQDSPEGE
jgi:hypothetical protein